MRLRKNAVPIAIFAMLVPLVAGMVAAGPAVAKSASPTASSPTSAHSTYVRIVRSIDATGLGVRRPESISFLRAQHVLVVAGQGARGSASARRVRLSGDALGALRSTGHIPPGNVAVDPSTARRYVLHANGPRMVVTGGSDRRQVIDLPGLHAAGLRAIAVRSQDHHVFLLSTTPSALYELTSSGDLLSTRDLGSASLANPQAMIFAPSGDSTDAASTQDLYVADAGVASRAAAPSLRAATTSVGQVVELSLVQPYVAALALGAYHGTLVSTIDTSAWADPAPDPSGLAYRPYTGHLLVADSEIEEYTRPYFHGFNAWEASTSGAELTGSSVLNLTNEPTGIAVNPSNDHVFISNDTGDEIIEVNLGPDHTLHTADDSASAFSTAAFGDPDPEDVAYGAGQLFVVDGLDGEVYVVSPGPNGICDGVPPAGDDTTTHFDTSVLGQPNPEGIEYNAAANTLYIVSNEPNSDLTESTLTGGLVKTVDLSFLDAYGPAAIAVAPSSVNPAVDDLYISDRGVDNNPVPLENDGKVYEISIDQGPPANLLPNPGFELQKWNINGNMDGWQSASLFSRSSADAHSGTYSGRFFSSSNGGANLNSQTITNITAGDSYDVSSWTNIPPTSDSFTYRFQVRWYDDTGATISTQDVRAFTAPTAGWVQAASTLVAPPAARTAVVRLLVNSLAAPIYVDDFVFKPSAGQTNHPPVAANDAYQATAGQTLVVASPGVLGNDSDPDGNQISAQLVSGAAQGSLNLSANGSFTYSPAGGYTGPDSFTYQATDGSLSSNTATVSITVTQANQPPVAVNDAYQATAGQTLSVPAPGVLGNDSDPDGNQISAQLVSGAAHGSLNLSANGSFTYTPGGGYTGPDSFTYQATDGSLSSNTATVSITVNPAGNQPPQVTNPGPQSGVEGGGVTLQIQASDPDGDPLSYAATGLPPGLSVDASIGRISGTISAGAASGSPFNVQVSVFDGQATTQVGFTWTVTAAGSGITFRGASQATVLGPSLTIPVPSGVAAGDVMVAGVDVRGAATITPPAGWTLLRDEVNGTDLRQDVYLKVASGSEPASYSWSFPGQQPASGGIAAYAGVDTQSPVDVSGGQANGGQKAVTAPSVTTTVPGDRLVGFFGMARNAAMTPPASMAERVEAARNSVTTEVADEAFAGPGSTGTRVAMGDAGALNIGQLVALRPA